MRLCLGMELKVCRRSYTCCTPEIEDQLHAESVLEYEKKLTEKSMLMKAHYEKKYTEFNGMILNINNCFYKSMANLQQDI